MSERRLQFRLDCRLESLIRDKRHRTQRYTARLCVARDGIGNSFAMFRRI